MRIDGEWHHCDDGVVRPTLDGRLLAADGRWLPAPFLIDTGADRTVLTRMLVPALQMPEAPATSRLGGLGGTVDCRCVDTQIRLTTNDRRKVVFHGTFAVAPDEESLDMSVIGRDILGLFATIVDFPGNAVCLLSQGHAYQILSN